MLPKSSASSRCVSCNAYQTGLSSFKRSFVIAHSLFSFFSKDILIPAPHVIVFWPRLGSPPVNKRVLIIVPDIVGGLPGAVRLLFQDVQVFGSRRYRWSAFFRDQGYFGKTSPICQVAGNFHFFVMTFQLCCVFVEDRLVIWLHCCLAGLGRLAGCHQFCIVGKMLGNGSCVAFIEGLCSCTTGEALHATSKTTNQNLCIAEFTI